MSMMMALLVALSATEDPTVEIKVYVKGMSCPTGCGTKLQKSLSALPGAKETKLADFEQGLFTVAVDAKTAIKLSEIKKAAAGFEVSKVVATLVGSVTKEKDGYVLATPSGAKYAVSAASKEECAKALKPGAKAECPIGKLESLLAEKKIVKVTGLLDECCQGALSIALLSVETCTACEAKSSGAN
jgi:hypothetical protein